jgi:sec-independent protein translocase protein TatA
LVIKVKAGIGPTHVNQQEPEKKEGAMFSPGPWELAIILIIVLVIFGAGKLPEIGSGLGKGIKNFRKSTSGKEDIDVSPSVSSTSSSEIPASEEEEKQGAAS